MESTGSTHRPRVEGDREMQIFRATLDLLVESGYDKLTLDAVAARARASKATLYRRWSSKTDLVVDAVGCLPVPTGELPDTGSLRGDLLALAEAKGLLQPEQAEVLCGLATAIFRDAELRGVLLDRYGDTGSDLLHGVLRRARERGDVRPDADLDLIGRVLPAMILFHQLHLAPPGQLPPHFVATVIDQVVLPALQHRPDPAPGT